MALVFQNLSRFVSKSTMLGSWKLGLAAYSTPTLPKFDEMVKKNKVVVFMKGVPEQPMCGFSNAVVQILRMHGVQYDSYDVLSDEAIRQGILCGSCIFTNCYTYSITNVRKMETFQF